MQLISENPRIGRTPTSIRTIRVSRGRRDRNGGGALLEDDTASGAGTKSSTTRRITPEVSANATEELVFDVNSRSRST
jgi:hypothetical protein